MVLLLLHVQIFRLRVLIAAVSEEKLRQLIEALGTFLLDERVRKTGPENENSELCKFVNILMLRILVCDVETWRKAATSVAQCQQSLHCNPRAC